MKKLLIVALALASTNAFATRARLNALGNAVHLVDTQTVLTNPADMMFMGDYVNFESGTTAGGAYQSNAEGTVTRSFGEGKLGLTLGNQSENASAWTGAGGTTVGLRTLASDAFWVAAGQPANTGLSSVKGQQNPVAVHYGMKMADMSVAGTLVYSNYNDKVADEKESSGGFRLGMRNDVWDANLGIGLLNTYKKGTEEFKGTGGYSAAAGYKMGDMYYHGKLVLAGFKAEDAGAEKIKLDRTSIAFSAIKNHKQEGGNLFYGVTLEQSQNKIEFAGGAAEIKSKDLLLPLIIGVEADVNSWLAVRGSITQTSIINNFKSEVNGTTASEFAPNLNSTVAAVGAGLKFDKLTVDGTLQGLTGDSANQQLDGNDLLTTVGVTYLF